MKPLIKLIVIALLATGCCNGNSDKKINQRQSLDKATAAIRDAFAQGDVPAIVALHSPQIVKYFGGANVVTGRPALEAGLIAMFKSNTVQFIENKVESTVFAGTTAIQTSIFTMKITPKSGGKASFAHGRSMVVYIQDKHSPTGWYSLREMAQAAP